MIEEKTYCPYVSCVLIPFAQSGRHRTVVGLTMLHE
nr:MAG TPA_asm: hypothetical protein [Caudoviricetes sp.]